MSSDGSTRWYALHVRSRHEKTVHALLETKQQNAFLPLYTVKNKWADRMKSISLPLFPGYVFCRFDPANRYPVVATSGVIDVVRIGTDPAAIDDSEIDALQLIVNARVAAQPHPVLVKGQSVVLTDGPLKGLAGTIANIRNDLRLVVNVELLCRSVLVEIDRDCMMPCESRTGDVFFHEALSASA